MRIYSERLTPSRRNYRHKRKRPADRRLGTQGETTEDLHIGTYFYNYGSSWRTRPAGMRPHIYTANKALDKYSTSSKTPQFHKKC